LQQTAEEAGNNMTKIGLALGSGGAKGLAHVLMLEALDELGLKPDSVSGTSIGAVAGVMYCSGMTGRELRELIVEMTISKSDSIKEILSKKQSFKWLDFISPRFAGSGLLRSENFIEFVLDSFAATTFEELQIPLKVVASDFWSRQEVVLEHGDLAPAIQASISLPGLFAPVVLGEKVLIDGGAVNPVPFDLLPGDCDIAIAVDVIGQRAPDEDMLPSISEAVFNTYQIMEKTIIREKLKHRRPDIYIEPQIEDVRVLDFYRVKEVFVKADSAKDQLKRQLATLLETTAASG
jgi:NTE family protein